MYFYLIKPPTCQPA